jgi:hypothetical protein
LSGGIAIGSPPQVANALLSKVRRSELSGALATIRRHLA